MSLDLILRIFAFLTVTAFVAVLVIEVPRLDLAGVIGATVLLLLWDFFFHRET